MEPCPTGWDEAGLDEEGGILHRAEALPGAGIALAMGTLGAVCGGYLSTVGLAVAAADKGRASVGGADAERRASQGSQCARSGVVFHVNRYLGSGRRVWV